MTYLGTGVAKRLRILAIERDKTVQALLEDIILKWLEANDSSNVVTLQDAPARQAEPVAQPRQKRQRPA